MREAIIRTIDEQKIIVILRGFTRNDALLAAEAMYEGGIRLIEVTFDKSGKIPLQETAAQIAALKRQFEGRLLVGAGTVTSVEEVVLAHRAGAGYIISPDTNEAVIKKTRKLGMVSIPGALTPTEAVNAARCGADYVKIFPASAFGPSFIKAISAPLPHLKFLAVGGIDENNLGAYLSAGAAGAGIGANIANREEILAGNLDAVRARAAKYTEAVKTFSANK